MLASYNLCPRKEGRKEGRKKGGKEGRKDKHSTLYIYRCETISAIITISGNDF